MAHTIVTAEFPIVLVRVHGECTLESTAQYYREIPAVMRRGRHAQILDYSEADRWMNVDVQRMIAAWIRDHKEFIRQTVVCTAVVFRSPIARFVFSSVLAMTPFTVPTRAVATVDEARAWARARLAEEDKPKAVAAMR